MAGAAGHTLRVTFWALLVEYEGGPFHGWQRQDGAASVQHVLETAAARLTGAKATAHAAGRTDAGVHASGQVAGLELPDRLDARQVRDALNFHMRPAPVVVVRAAPAPAGWHPRFAAIGRSYCYMILNRPARPALAQGRVWHVGHPLDERAMQDGAAHLLGHHDFTSFRAAACQANGPMRTLDRLDVTRRGDTIEIVAEARSFLHHQVRNMVGTLALVGTGRWPPSQVGEALEARDRRAAGPTAPAEGLCLTAVRYPMDLWSATQDA